MPVAQRDVSITAGDGRPMRAVVTLPAAAGPRPGLVIIYEVYGLVPEMRALGQRFADNGYASIIPDLFDRPEPALLCVLRAGRSVLRGEGREFADIEAARQALRTLPEVDGERVGVVGFCLGGGFAIVLAGQGGYQVAAPFYGRVPDDLEPLRRACPVVASYGGQDLTTRGDARRLGDFLRQAGTPHDVRLYPEAGHSFMTRGQGFFAEVIAPISPMHAGYHEPSAEDSWRRILAFFGRHLATPPP